MSAARNGRALFPLRSPELDQSPEATPEQDLGLGFAHVKPDCHLPRRSPLHQAQVHGVPLGPRQRQEPFGQDGFGSVVHWAPRRCVGCRAAGRAIRRHDAVAKRWGWKIVTMGTSRLPSMAIG